MDGGEDGRGRGASLFRNAIFRDGVLDLHQQRRQGRLSLPRRLRHTERMRTGMFGNGKRSRVVARHGDEPRRQHCSTSRLIDNFFVRHGVRRQSERDDKCVAKDVAMRSHFLLGHDEPETTNFSIAELVEQQDRRRGNNEHNEATFSSNVSDAALVASPIKGYRGNYYRRNENVEYDNNHVNKYVCDKYDNEYAGKYEKYVCDKGDKYNVEKWGLDKYVKENNIDYNDRLEESGVCVLEDDAEEKRGNNDFDDFVALDNLDAIIHRHQY